jgi:hypothetical protein
MVSKHLELTKKQVRDCYRRFASPTSHTAPPPSCIQEAGSSSHHHTAPPPSRIQEAGSSSHHHTTPPPSRQEEASFDDSVVEMWVVGPPTRPEEASFDDSPPPASSGYNAECPHVKEVSSYELLQNFNCLV